MIHYAFGSMVTAVLFPECSAARSPPRPIFSNSLSNTRVSWGDLPARAELPPHRSQSSI